MELQKFVMEVIEALGGVVIPKEYALCQVLIPEEYKHYFQGRTELEFSFDFEVAGENPQSEFVTFGSYWLEQIFFLAQSQAVSTVRFAEVDRLTLTNALDKIKRFMNDEPGQMSLLNERLINCGYVHLTFRASYLSDEKDEEVHKVWVNLATGHCCDQMKTVEDHISYQDKPVYSCPISPMVGLEQAFAHAYRHVRTKVEAGRQRRQQSLVLDKEINRINEYYNELIAENARRSLRKGTEEERKAEIAAKEIAIQSERERQIQEIEIKYNVNIELALDHCILYFVPQIEYEVRVFFRNQYKTVIVRYHCLTKHFTKMP